MTDFKKARDKKYPILDLQYFPNSQETYQTYKFNVISSYRREGADWAQEYFKSEIETLKAERKSWYVAKEIEIYANSDKQWNEMIEKLKTKDAVIERLREALEHIRNIDSSNHVSSTFGRGGATIQKDMDAIRWIAYKILKETKQMMEEG